MWRSFAGILALLTLLCTCDRAQKKKHQGLVEEGDIGTNHLAGQKSPYLLQHASNPVDWYPWGQDALQKAAKEDKLLVISVGYAACHWCHVMEHESFEDSLVAAVMNEHFVSIKVDREERPDVDEVYMTACQLSNQRGCGWPLNAIALPDGRPIWAGTYFPKDQWLKILERFTELQLTEPGKMETYAASLTDELIRQNSVDPITTSSAPLTLGQVNLLAQSLQAEMDLPGGGTKGAPKFPMPVLHEFLLAHHYHTKDATSLQAVTRTLDAMAAGGIYDQLGGGFSRYSTDEEWLVPHFEKMLYDNAQLVSLYAKAYQLTGQARYAEVVEETLRFVERRFSHPDGPFYASLDADTEGEEGKTYIWSQPEIETSLADEPLTAAFSDYFGVSTGGNWEGHNILTRQKEMAAVAQKYGYATTTKLAAALDNARQTLLAIRNERPQPPLDDKALTSWNALMISGYTNAYRALGAERYRQRAVRAGHFLWNNVRSTDNRLDRNFKDGASAINGFLDDYALFAQACIDLYQVTFDETWLNRATDLIAYTNDHFYDAASGLYRYTSDEDPPLVSGHLPTSDKVIPSSNSALARVQHQLGILTADEAMVQRAREMLTVMMPKLISGGPRFYANWALLYLELLQPTYEVAILGEDAGAVRDQMSKQYLPHALLLGGTKEGNLTLLTNKLNPGATTIYVCLEKVCQLPVTNPELALEQLRLK